MFKPDMKTMPFFRIVIRLVFHSDAFFHNSMVIAHGPHEEQNYYITS